MSSISVHMNPRLKCTIVITCWPSSVCLFDFSEITRRNWTELDRKQVYSTLSTKFVFSGQYACQQTWPPCSLICRDIFDFSSATAERKLTKLDREYSTSDDSLPILCFRGNPSTKVERGTPTLLASCLASPTRSYNFDAKKRNGFSHGDSCWKYPSHWDYLTWLTTKILETNVTKSIGTKTNGMNLVTCASKLKVVRGIPGQLI